MASTPAPLTPEQKASFDEDRGPAVIAVSSVFIGLCTIAVGLRFYARANRRMAFGLDDWMAAGSLVSDAKQYPSQPPVLTGRFRSLPFFIASPACLVRFTRASLTNRQRTDSAQTAVPYGMGRHAWAADTTKTWRILQVNTATLVNLACDGTDCVYRSACSTPSFTLLPTGSSR